MKIARKIAKMTNNCRKSVEKLVKMLNNPVKNDQNLEEY